YPPTTISPAEDDLNLTTEQIEIRPVSRPVDAEIQIPGSKSITNRALLMAALAEGNEPSVLENALYSEDSHWCSECLQKLGIRIEEDEAGATFTVHGQGGHFPVAKANLFVGNSGTTARSEERRVGKEWR